jgi:hypothetical protein
MSSSDKRLCVPSDRCKVGQARYLPIALYEELLAISFVLSTHVLVRIVCRASISCYFEPIIPALTQCHGAVGTSHGCQRHQAGHQISKKAAQTQSS